MRRESSLSWDIAGRMQALRVMVKQINELQAKAALYGAFCQKSINNFDRAKLDLAGVLGLLGEEYNRYKNDAPTGDEDQP